MSFDHWRDRSRQSSSRGRGRGRIFHNSNFPSSNYYNYSHYKRTHHYDSRIPHDCSCHTRSRAPQSCERYKDFSSVNCDHSSRHSHGPRCDDKKTNRKHISPSNRHSNECSCRCSRIQESDVDNRRNKNDEHFRSQDNRRNKLSSPARSNGGYAHGYTQEHTRSTTKKKEYFCHDVRENESSDFRKCNVSKEKPHCRTNWHNRLITSQEQPIGIEIFMKIINLNKNDFFYSEKSPIF